MTIGEDNDHTMAIWDWDELMGADVSTKPGVQLPSGKEEVFGVSMNADGGIVTYGPKYVKFWSKKEGTLKSKGGKFGMKDPAPKAILCCAFTPKGLAAVGGDNGQVYFFDFEGVLKNKVSAHDGAVTGLVRVDGDAPFLGSVGAA